MSPLRASLYGSLYVKHLPKLHIMCPLAATVLHADVALSSSPLVLLNPETCWFTLKQVTRDQYQQ